MFNIDSFLNFNNGSLKIEFGEYTDYPALRFVINKNSIGHYNIKYERLYRNGYILVNCFSENKCFTSRNMVTNFINNKIKDASFDEPLSNYTIEYSKS